MITLKERTTLVGISELRSKVEEVLQRMNRSTVILERRHRPLAVMLPIDRYEKMEALLDWVDDRILGVTALRRERGTPRKHYLLLEDLERRLKSKSR